VSVFSALSRPLLLAAMVAFLGCQQTVPPSEVPPESDAGVLLEPERDIVMPVDGELVQVTRMRGAEELEVRSPDGAWVAFVNGSTGWAAVWAVPMPTAADPAPTPIQLTNRGLEDLPRTPGKAPPGFVPVPDSAKGLRWVDDRTVAWTNQGREYSVEVPR